MIICGYCVGGCGYWVIVCGYCESSIPATFFAGQTARKTPLRVLAGIEQKPNAYTPAHTRARTCTGSRINTRQYPQYPQRLSDLQTSLRVLDPRSLFDARSQYPQYPQPGVTPNG